MVSVQPIIQVLMIIVSCLLAWGEAWFLDCRVIPQEKNAQRFYRLLMVIEFHFKSIFQKIHFFKKCSVQQSQDNERSPLLDSYLNAVCNIGASVTDGSVANFYSPMESAHNSDCDDDEVSDSKPPNQTDIFKKRKKFERFIQRMNYIKTKE